MPACSGVSLIPGEAFAKTLIMVPFASCFALNIWGWIWQLDHLVDPGSTAAVQHSLR